MSGAAWRYDYGPPGPGGPGARDPIVVPISPLGDQAAVRSRTGMTHGTDSGTTVTTNGIQTNNQTLHDEVVVVVIEPTTVPIRSSPGFDTQNGSISEGELDTRDNLETRGDLETRGSPLSRGNSMLWPSLSQSTSPGTDSPFLHNTLQRYNPRIRLESNGTVDATSTAEQRNADLLAENQVLHTDISRVTRQYDELRDSVEQLQRTITTVQARNQVLEQQVTGRHLLLTCLLNTTLDPGMLLAFARPPLGQGNHVINSIALFDSLFHAVRKWVCQYANIAVTLGRRSRLPFSVRTKFNRICQPSNWSDLYWDPNARWALITRLFIEFLTAKVLSVSLLQGYSEKWDDEIRQRSLTGHHSSRRDTSHRDYFEWVSNMTWTLINAYDGSMFLRRKFNDLVRELDGLMAALMRVDYPHGTRFRAFKELLEWSFMVGIAMNLSAAEWDFQFPSPGTPSDGREYTDWGSILQSPRQNATAPVRAFVKLAIVPKITRSHWVSQMVADQIYRAGVLLME